MGIETEKSKIREGGREGWRKTETERQGERERQRREAEGLGERCG